MKLAELAIIQSGLTLNHDLRSEAGPNDYAYLTPENLLSPETKVRYIPEKEARKKPIPNRLLLQYGDYLIFLAGNDLKLHRYDQVGSKRTVAGAGFILIRSDFKILTDFLGYEKNKAYFLKGINGIRQPNTLPRLADLAGIVIPTGDILELENANVAESIGIGSPLDLRKEPVRIEQMPMPMDKLMKRIEYGDLLLDTEFQRRPGLWNVEVKSRFIESMIVRMPVPAFYFDGSDDDKWLVIDGLQRLSTTRDFLDGKFALTKLDYLSDLEGKTFVDLDRPLQRNIEEFVVFAYILREKSRKAIAYKLFRTINTSGLRLESQEIRHAINPGLPAEFLKSVATTEWFERLMPMSDRKKERMENREAVLRFVAFREALPNDYKPGDGISDFLDKAMTSLYDLPELHLRLYESELKSSLENINEVLGEEAFSRTLFDPERKMVSHNSIMFETLTYGFSKLSAEEKKALSKKKALVREGVMKFFGEKDIRFWDSDSAYTYDGTRRFEQMEQLLRNLSRQL